MEKLAALFLFASAGCSQPLIGDLGTLSGGADANAPEDAASDTGPSPGAADAEIDTGLVVIAEGGCIDLPDYASPNPSPLQPNFLSFKLDDDPACSALYPDDQGSVIYALAEQTPLVQRGRTYAFHWTLTSILTRLLLVGGDDPCPREVVVDMPVPQALTPSPLGPLPTAGCQSFASPVTARYLLLPESVMGETVVYTHHAFKLCEGACPP